MIVNVVISLVGSSFGILYGALFSDPGFAIQLSAVIFLPLFLFSGFFMVIYLINNINLEKKISEK